MEANPWEQLAEKFPIGARLTGKVRNLTEFGAFVEVEEGIDGLIHISDLSWTKRVKHPSEVLKKGDAVEAGAVVLATGGYSNVYYLSTNAMACNATAMWRAHRRGCS